MPVLCGSALKNKGIQPMLDGVIDYLPSPLDVPPVTGLDPRSDGEVTRHTDATEPFAALAFKIAADPFVGKLAFFRVYSGTLKTGSYVYNSTKGTRSASAACCSCTRITAKRSSRSAPATSPPRWG